MANFNLVQITPKLPPEMDGIGDYAFKLAEGLSEHHKILTHFLACAEDFKPAPNIKNFSIIKLPNHKPQAILSVLPKNTDLVLLHYSEYMYEPKYGTPFWLVEALAAAKQQQKFKLLVMFHELPYFFLHKRLYLLPFQYFVASRLAKIADIVVTNNSGSQAALETFLNCSVKSIPVFSNIGEPNHLPSLVKRKRRLVVFGTPLRRGRIYQKRARAKLINICRLLKIEEIIDIGSPVSLKIPEIKGVPVVCMGRQSAQDVSSLLLNSLAGIAYSNDNSRLSKSGVFATYCAHGVVPVITHDKSSPADGLEVGKNFLFAGNQSQSIELESLQIIADNAYEWYQNHTQAKNVEAFASQILGNSS
ncbi:MAG: hypothetical protein F6K31_05560 [Symploca sp. SIO2G7]|nr:hypothetical protein [Symploca sp. SIO2G7]